MRTIVAIGIAGALGALARYGLDGAVSRRFPSHFPWGTFVVNMSGAFVLGFLMTLMTEQLTTASWVRSAWPPRTCSAAPLSVSSPCTSESSQRERYEARRRRQAAAAVHRRIRHMAWKAALPGDRRARAT